ncbi:replication endonuclease [Shewanella abyssi]|uniref:replication endonuclease n=1 Tax=Shewanella abyssi TaxID=311789 RepID=UPI00200C6807|nr:replication endonuclease [Shewanella abyssi]MCL1050366.1 replication endonuclease [Shewanella abyssi]
MDLQQIERKAGINLSAIFSAPHQQEDLKWAQKQLDGLPDGVAASLFKEYVRKHKKYSRSSSANIWLRNRIKSTRAMLRQFPLPLWHINTEVRRAAVAQEWANRCASILNNMTYGGTQVDAVELLKAVKQPADQWGFSPVLPSLIGYEQRKASGELDEDPTLYNIIAGALARLVDDAWWLRKLEKSFRQYKEHAAIITGKVRAGVSPYASVHALKEYQNRKKAAERWLNEMTVVNDNLGLEISLADAVAASVSNPTVRRAELMVRIRGFEELANEQGMMGGFFTVTAPSCYHSYMKSKKGPTYSNKRYLGANPKDTQAYLCKEWAKVRSKLARLDLPLFGFRVVEPHHDATPHWHMLLFFKPEHEQAIRFVMADYFTRANRDELKTTNRDFDEWGLTLDTSINMPMRSIFKKALIAEAKALNHNDENQHAFLLTHIDNVKQQYRTRLESTFKKISPRFDYKVIDPNQGSATGYIAKYIAKNIDGLNVDDDLEAESSGKHGAMGVATWASDWNIRQFQQIGGPAVTVWRELRRLRESIDYDDILELARKASDGNSSNNWKRYIDVMGGTFCKRADRPIQLSKVTNPEANLYGEDITKIMGVMSMNNAVQTRFEGWEIRPQGQSKPTVASANPVFDVAVDLSFDSSLKSGDSRAPWSSDNNCTRSIKTANSIAKIPLKDRQLIKEAKKLGLDSDSLKRLRAGAVIDVVDPVDSDAHKYVRLRDGMLIVSKQLPSGHHKADNDWRDSALESQFDAIERQRLKVIDAQLREQAWRLLDTGSDVENWISSKTPDMAKRALEQLRQVLDTQKAEQWASSSTYHDNKNTEQSEDENEPF